MAGRGNVENRGKGSWRLTVSMGVDKDGKYIKKRKTVKAKNKTEARSLLSEFIVELEAGEYVAPSHIRFGDYVPTWRKDTSKKVSPKTIETYDYVLNARILPALSHFKMEDISHVHINDFLEELEEAELATSTIQKHYNVLSSIFKLAVRNETIKKNPMEKVDKPSVNYKSGQVYNSEELKRLYELLDKEENKQQVLIVKTALKTGMRKGEILALQKSDLDTEKNVIHIRHSLSYTKENGYQLKEPKTKGSNRKIGIPATLMKELSVHAEKKFKDRDKAEEQWKGGNHLYVFSADFGTPLYPSVPSRWWSRFLKRTGFKKIRFHDLRHSFATDLISRGGNINKISKYLGHASITTSMDIYGHLIEEDREIADMVAEDYV